MLAFVIAVALTAESGAPQKETADINDRIDEADVRAVGRVEPRPEGSVANAVSVVDDPSIEADAVTRYIHARMRAVLSCYAHDLKAQPALAGTIEIRFTLATSGRVTDVELLRNTVNEPVASCIRTYVRGWVLPFKPTKDVHISYPFAFSPK